MQCTALRRPSDAPRTLPAKARGLVAVSVLFVLPVFAVFAGGSTNDVTLSYGAYQTDFDTGRVAVDIRGRSDTQVVTLREEGIPAGISVNAAEQGGILTVTATADPQAPASAKSASTSTQTAPATGRIYVTMPRYEFVHIKTDTAPVTIDNLSTEHLTIHTHSGNIDVTNTNAALHAQSTTGNQDYNQIYGAIDATSTTGSVQAAGTWGVMNLKSTTGSLAGKDLAIAGNSSFSTTTGAIRLVLAYAYSRYTFDLRSTPTGKIQLGSVSGVGDLHWGYGAIHVVGATEGGVEDIQ